MAKITQVEESGTVVRVYIGDTCVDFDPIAFQYLIEKQGKDYLNHEYATSGNLVFDICENCEIQAFNQLLK